MNNIWWQTKGQGNVHLVLLHGWVGDVFVEVQVVPCLAAVVAERDADAPGMVLVVSKRGTAPVGIRAKSIPVYSLVNTGFSGSYFMGNSLLTLIFVMAFTGILWQAIPLLPLSVI